MSRTPKLLQTGLTAQEQAVMDHLIQAWNLYMQLPVVQVLDSETMQYDTFSQQVAENIMRVQHILGIRALSRIYPDYWL